MKFCPETTLSEVMATASSRAVLVKHHPDLLMRPDIARDQRRTLKEIRPIGRPQQLQALLDDLNRPFAEIQFDETAQKSMDEFDRESFAARFTPWDEQPEMITLDRRPISHPPAAPELILDGEWQLAEGGTLADRLHGDWSDAIRASVPGSVHSALVEAGRIPDPTFDRNQIIAHQESFKTWWMRRDFARPTGMNGAQLAFGGVANRCTVWLNGQMLGSHEGMFGGPDFDIAPFLRDENTLIVRLDPILFEPQGAPGPNPDNNDSWKRTVVFNNAYGWHYSNLPSLGIWRSVVVQSQPAVALAHPFARTVDAHAGIVELALQLEGSAEGWSGTLSCSIAPENFEGGHCYFSMPLRSRAPILDELLRFQIPDPRLWWPVDVGDANLYRITLSFAPDDDRVADVHSFTFGLRTIEMAPLPGGPQPELYNWTFVINGKKMFIKGTNWCTLDPLMDFSRDRYERFIKLAAMQHIQMFRPWGSGMPETDDFYDLCDRYGILVMQEWPTAWNSHVTQPLGLLEETVWRNTLRLRNHPSLAMYGAGNESSEPFGPAIDMMGRLSIELDDTRLFHRGEPWGGSLHNYDCYWGRQSLDHNLNMTSIFFGEFGLACSPIYESMQRFLPDDEKDLWPPRDDGAFAYHTPIFNTGDDVSRLMQYANYFVPKDCTLEEYTVGSQLSQVVGIRHTLERARCNWPFSTGVLYYKLTDNYPAASWACIDWYGAPKIGHYFFQDAFAPLHACLLFTSVHNVGTPLELPVYLLDDANALDNTRWQVVVCAYDGQLRQIKRSVFEGPGEVESPAALGMFTLSFQQTDTVPLFIIAEVWAEDHLADRSFYFVNYEPVKGSLFTLPPTTLIIEVQGEKMIVKNRGSLPAVAVNVSRPGHLDTFTVSDNYFWLDAGESAVVVVNAVDGLAVSAWNAPIATQ